MAKRKKASNGKGCLYWLLFWWWELIKALCRLVVAISKATDEYNKAKGDSKSKPRISAEPIVYYKGKPIQYESPLDSKTDLKWGCVPAAHPSGFEFGRVLVVTETTFDKETGEVHKVEKTIYADHAQTEHVKSLIMEMLGVYAKSAKKSDVEHAAKFINSISAWNPKSEEEPPRGAHPCYEYRGDKARFTVAFSVEDYDPFTDKDYAAFGRVNKNGELMDGTLRFYKGTSGDVFSVKRVDGALTLIEKE